jgi:cytochrome oxidase assembly protein ShyY1
VTLRARILTGYLRFAEAAGALTPAEDPKKRLWFTRDHLTMARVLGWGEVAPFYIDLNRRCPTAACRSRGRSRCI